MDFRQLRYFVAVATEQHFHRGAKLLRVSQPAVSRQIRLLEEELGIALFQRSSRGVQLTRAGSEFLMHAKLILNNLELAKLRTRRYVDGYIGEVRVGINEVAARHPIVRNCFRLLRTNHPEVTLKLEPMISYQQTNALLNMDIDAGFMYYRPNVEGPFETVKVYRERFCLAVPAAHPLAHKETLSLSDLKGEPLIWPTWRYNERLVTQLKEQFDRAGVSPLVIQEADYEHQVLSLVSATVGIGFVMQSMNESRQIDDVVIRSADDFEVTTSLEFTWISRNRSASLQRLMSALDDALAAEVPEGAVADALERLA